MRTMTSPAISALARSPLPMAVLVEMDLTAPLRLNSAGFDMTLAGVAYSGAEGLGRVEAIEDTPGEMKQLAFTLSGVPSSQIALALAEPTRGKTVRVKLGIFDPDNYQLLEINQKWIGMLEPIAIEDAKPVATLQVKAENAALDLVRPTYSVYSDSEQRRLNPGDPSLQFMSDQVDVRVVWPAASWGRK